MGAKKNVTVAAEEAPKSVRLKNRTKRAYVFNLSCKEYCSDGDCVCAKVEGAYDEYNAQTGEHTKKIIERKICGSVTFLVGATEELKATATKVPEIAAAIGRGDLVVLG